MLIAKSNLICCNFPTLRSQNPTLQPNNLKWRRRVPPHRTTIASGCRFSSFLFLKPSNTKTITNFPAFRKRGGSSGGGSSSSSVHVCHNSKKEREVDGVNGTEGRDWTTSILLFVLWGGLMYYVFFLSPNQTPSRDNYFLRKLLNLKGDDGFRMNEVLVSLWYLMGLWPLAYSMLLLPTGRSSKSNIPVWPFLILSCFGGVYALLPYFVLWKPPAPPVEETELKKWPLNFLESKVTATIFLVTGIGIITYAGLAGENAWKEFYQYFRESKFIHIMSIDFTLLSTLAPFWVYNDMTARKWFDKGSWLFPISLIPFLGPALYILLRPSLSTVAISPTAVEPE